MVPEGWERRTYGDVSVINRENIPPSGDPDRRITYLDIGSVPELGRISEELERFRFGEAPSRARRVVKHGDIVVSTVRPYLQGFARITEPPDDLVASTGFAVLTPTSGVTSEFLFQTVCSHRFISQLESKMVGSNYPAVNITDVRETTLLVPPLPEQKKIATILSSVDDAIAANRKVIEQTKRVKKGLLQDLMTRGIGHSRFKETEIGEIPEEWEVYSADSLCQNISVGIVVRPASLYVEDGVPCIRSANIGEDGIIDEDWVYISQESSEDHAKSILQSGDVVVVRTGEPGTACVVPNWLDSSNCIDIIFARPEGDRIDSHFFSWFLNSPAGRRQVLQKRGGLAQKHLNVGALKKMLVPLPPLEEQRLIVDRIASAVEMEKSAQGEMKRLECIKRGLMQDLLTGRVRVPVD